MGDGSGPQREDREFVDRLLEKVTALLSSPPLQTPACLLLQQCCDDSVVNEPSGRSDLQPEDDQAADVRTRRI
jgi:hypothetical protein